MKLEIKNLHVSVEGKEIIKGINLTIQSGTKHAIMGRNGSGKSTLANTIAGHPKYEITKGQIILNGQDITNFSPDKRAIAGIFLSFQYPVEIEGVTLTNFLRTAYNSINKDEPKSISQFFKYLKEKMSELEIDKSFARRYLNKGFSGGEKKKAEILQMSILNPKFIILDETDSGLDVDALEIVGKGIEKIQSSEKSFLVITHYERILKFVKPDFIHIMKDGQIIKSGGIELAKQIEEQGFKDI